MLGQVLIELFWVTMPFIWTAFISVGCIWMDREMHPEHRESVHDWWVRTGGWH